MTPERLGPYRLGAVVEARAFTVTYRAEHVTLGRRALVKALRPTVDAASPLAAELEREAGLLARLGHEGGAPEVYELVRAADALGFAMEDPGGARLSELLAKKERLEPAVALAVVLELARGLGVAHARGVVHLGLCPDIVELTPSGRVLVMDYASAEDDRGRGERRERAPAALTRARLEPADAERTSGYIAPEQLLGDDAGPPSDVFALGALLVALTSEAPRAGEGRAARLDALSPPPSKELATHAPAALEPIVRRCLARVPEDRYPTAALLAQALQGALAQATSLAPRALIARALTAAGLAPHRSGALREAEDRPPPSKERPAALWPIAGAFAALLALIVAGGVVLQLGARAGASPSAAAAASSTRAKGSLRVLARPWADVYLDGALVDTTPIGRPIDVAPGRHYVTFKHPSAADEERAVDVLPGQAVTVDVLMRLTTPPRDAGPTSEEADASP